MRALRLAAAALAAAALGTGCAARSTPYRFSMPMLGHADVPPARLGRQPADAAPARPARIAHRAEPGAPVRPRRHYAYGWQIDAQSGIRVASAKGIELTAPDASSRSALDVTAGGAARHSVWSHLPAPQHDPSTGLAAAVSLARPIREVADLRTLVGTRDKRDPFLIATAWLSDIGLSFVPRGSPVDMARAVAAAPTDGPSLVTWASERSALRGATEIPQAGDVLVFDRATADAPADLIAIVIGRDERGVTEFAYAGGGVIRRGFLDVSRPTTRRDLDGAIVNTFLRHGTRWPPKGTRYLAGELLAHVIRWR